MVVVEILILITVMVVGVLLWLQIQELREVKHIVKDIDRDYLAYLEELRKRQP